MHLLRMLPSPVRGQDLASELGISLRSVYRDIETLRQSGAVIDGEAGYGYVLIEDPALPPLMFSREETEALVLGLREVGEVGDESLAAAAGSALAKLKASLPDHVRHRLEHSVLHAKRFAPRPEVRIDIAALRAAMWDEMIVEIGYSDGHGRETRRMIKPLSIVYLDRAQMLLAWCLLRSAFRAFRVDRIQQLSVTKDSFRPARVALLKECLIAVRGD